VLPDVLNACPFSFVLNGQPSARLLLAWGGGQQVDAAGERSHRRTRTWTEPTTGLRVHCDARHWTDFPAVEWGLRFEQTGSSESGLIRDVWPLDVLLGGAVGRAEPFRLHATRGGPAVEADFEPYSVTLRRAQPAMLGAGEGRSSHRDLPFFKVETGNGTAIIAIGWSGNWIARLETADDERLHITAGMERTCFRLRPGEQVRTPRVLVFWWEGDPAEAHAPFRELIYRHYAARRGGTAPLPVPFCNTCFTRGGGWLNECNAENQISLIHAYADLDVEALVTDAGWFEGGWPAGAGNWNPRRDAYPQGMAPVAAAAYARGMAYGLWFEPERVVSGTAFQRAHPEWVLGQPGDPDTHLAKFGLSEVREYYHKIVADFMALPGFRVYRQDFNIDPLPYWRQADGPERVGMTEMQYIAGLYAYWEGLASAWPDCLLEECASGGNRIDLETVQRMHLHQKTDYWFHNDVDHASLWGLSQYLPNNTVVAHLNRMDDYSFHSTLAASLCLGWIADAPDFDRARGRALLQRYRAVRHLLVGGWYPLLPYSRDPGDWTGAQFHRRDLDEGLLLVFRHGGSPDAAQTVRLRGLGEGTLYEVVSDATGPLGRFRGEALRRGLMMRLPSAPGSDLVTYRPSGRER
jgi:alpha-galactosidase